MRYIYIVKNIMVWSLLLLSASGVFAQSNEIIDEVLLQQELSCGHGAYLVLSASAQEEDAASVEDAWQTLLASPWASGLAADKEAGDPMSLGEFAYLVMQAYEIPGGLMYRIFPSPRYASRELGFKGIIARDAGAYRNLSGQEALAILSTTARMQSEGRLQ